MDTTREYSRIVMIAAALAVAVLISFFYSSGTLQEMELRTLDGRFRLNSSAPRPAGDYTGIKQIDDIIRLIAPQKIAEIAPGIVFIDMPEAGSDIRIALSPDSCTTAVKILLAGGAKGIVINSLLSKPSLEGSDTSMAGVISSSRAVYLPVLFAANKDKIENLYMGDGITGVSEPWPLFIKQGASLGHINAFADQDGKLRRVPAVIRDMGRDVYHLGITTAFGMLGAKAKDIEFSPDDHTITVNLSRGRTIIVPLEKDNQLIVNWGAVEMKSLPHFAFKDIVESYRLVQYGLAATVDPKAFEGKICILGTKESNAVTGWPEPLKTDYSPASACGLVAASVLQQSFVRYAPTGVDIALIFIVSIVMGAALVNRKVLGIMMIGVIAALLVVASVRLRLGAPYLIIAIAVSVPLGMFLSRFRLFSGMLFTILSVACCLVVSAGLFWLLDIAIVTFYPVLAIITVFISFYAYTHLMGFFGNLHLFNLATKDGLTGLYNRRHFNLLIDAELGHAALHKARKLSLVMCDIDNFKKLNDIYGHQAGDKILKEFAKIMKSKCRQSDMVCRYGGEEFVIILCGAGANEAFKVAENIRQAIAEKSFTFKGHPYSTSMSMGLAEKTKEKTKEELIEKADQALYRAKNQGKNRVCVSK